MSSNPRFSPLKDGSVMSSAHDNNLHAQAITDPLAAAIALLDAGALAVEFQKQKRVVADVVLRDPAVLRAAADCLRDIQAGAVQLVPAGKTAG